MNVEKIKKFVKARNRFSSKAFGSPKIRDCMGPLHHLKEEVQELIDNPNDEMEWADCFLLILDAAWRKGYSVDDLFDFASKKLEINKKRKWKLNDNGVYNHVKENVETFHVDTYYPYVEGEHEEIMKEILGEDYEH